MELLTDKHRQIDMTFAFKYMVVSQSGYNYQMFGSICGKKFVFDSSFLLCCVTSYHFFVLYLKPCIVGGLTSSLSQFCHQGKPYFLADQLMKAMPS